jgi:hypothetical protein
MNNLTQIDLGGYEGSFSCPNCGNSINIKQGNNSDIFECRKYKIGPDEWLGCGKEWEVYAKEVTDK